MEPGSGVPILHYSTTPFLLALRLRQRLLNVGPLPVPLGGLLEGEGEAEDLGLFVEVADELEGLRQAVVHAAAGDEGWVAGEIGVDERGAGEGDSDVEVDVAKELRHLALQ